ncbi:MAG: ABC transporter ATP-binding protein/permease [Hyphomonadaceae bacterium]|nr:ABC transporter ATP-binding protein/permease [Hyphomonadaceae bacterium]
MTLGALFGRLWRQYIARYAGDFTLIAPALALVAAAGVSYAFILKYTTDGLIAGDARVLLYAPVAVVAAAGLRAFAMWAQAVTTQELALKVLRDLQSAMFAKLMAVDFARFSREEPGRLVSRFTNDINVVSEAIVRGAQASIRDTLTVIGALASMFWLDWMLALVVIAVFALAGPALDVIGKRARQRTHAAQIQLGGLAALLIETFGAARFVKTYGLEQRETQRANAAFEERRKIARKLAYNRASTVPLLEIIGGLALGGVLWIAAWRIGAQQMSVGDLIGMIGAVGVATPAARSLGQFNTLINEAAAALTRIFGLIDEAVTVRDKPDARSLAIKDGHIAFEDVAFAYDDALALSDLNFAIAPGETVALVGPSGAGKSTIFNLIARLYDVTGGTVRIDGVDVRDMTLASLRAGVALVSQEAALFNDTVRANIAFGRAGATHADIEDAARAAAAHDFIRALPQGYDTLVGERGGNLSGGERQRIALARAFLRDARILLLDEATSALDAESEAQVQAALARLSQGRTVLVIAHRLSTVRDADRILVLDGGRVVEMGAHDELMTRGGLYSRLNALQFRAE